MRVIEAGHIYEVQNVDGTGTQIIIFVRRRGHDGELLPDEDRHAGILCQELMRVVIDRARYLNDEDPCHEDVEIINGAREVLRKFEARAARRTIEKMPMPELSDTCPTCHHILCDHRHNDRLEHEARR